MRLRAGSLGKDCGLAISVRTYTALKHLAHLPALRHSFQHPQADGSDMLRWARPKVASPYPLRRGAWYPVTRVVKDDVDVDVHGKLVSVPRSVIELVDTPPRRWTVVPRPPNAVLLPANWGAQYVVCHNCRHRAPLSGAPPAMRCPRCNELFPIAWDEAYLGRK